MQDSIKFKFEATGTIWKLDFYGIDIELQKDQIQNIYSESRKIISEFEKDYSRFRDDSTISSLREKTGIFTLNKEFIEILKIYFEFYKITHGRFTPMAGETLEKLGYDKNYSFTPKRNVSFRLPNLLETIKILDEESIEITKPCILDFGGVGKGFLIEKVSKFIAKNYSGRFCVDGGGDIFYASSISSNDLPKLRTGLENPHNPKEVIGIYDLPINSALCGSSRNRRKWHRHSHIIDVDQFHLSPFDGSRVEAAWIVSNNVTIADTIATCVFLMPVEKIKAKYQFEYLILYRDFTIEKSSGFDVELFRSQNMA